MISKSLSFLEKQLPYFIRIHKTILLNPDCVKKLQNQPHTKTSGAVVLEDGTVLPVSRRQWPNLVRSVWSDEVPTAKAERSVIFISSDSTKSLLLRQLIQEYWPLTEVQVVENGDFLTEFISVDDHQPTLILIDLRQTTQSRLAVLRDFKETPRLRSLPVVLLVDTDTAVTRSAYALQANSVVVVPDSNSQFIVVMEQVCRYWLTMASLPSV